MKVENRTGSGRNETWRANRTEASGRNKIYVKRTWNRTGDGKE